MRYSVWNWNKGVYDVYEAPGEAPGQRPRPRAKGQGVAGAGVQPEMIMPVLPRDAVQVGSHETPQGRIAVHSSSPAAAVGAYEKPEQSPLVHSPWVTLGVGALALWVGVKLIYKIAWRL